tara:strand:+ start:494 stop:1564 length:1071 start_codon:yes stop_codon:yes gene_type:complete
LKEDLKKKLSGKRIGYIPVSQDFSSAGDRRRFLMYAKEYNLQWEIADPTNEYDILFITTMANVSEWIDYKKSHPETILIFDINNAFFFKKNIIWNAARGITRFISGRESSLYFYYNNVYIDMFKTADIVVCPTSPAKEFISKYNESVFLSFDYFGEDISSKKVSFNPRNPAILVWEGMGVTAKHLLSISNVLEEFGSRVQLRIITDRSYKLAGLYKVDVLKIFKSAKFNFEFFDWNIETYSKLITSSDIAIIPLNRRDTLAYHKPENKLALMWQHGMPVITSDTPAYIDSFSNTNMNLTCKDDDDWFRNIDLLLSDKFSYEEHMNSVENYLSQSRSKEAFIKTWDKIFNQAVNTLD